jgi:hypothetical protein
MLELGSYGEPMPGKTPRNPNVFICGLFDQNDSLIHKIPYPIINFPNNLNQPIISTYYISGRYMYYNGEVIVTSEEDTIYKVNSDSIYKAFILSKGDLNPNYLQKYTRERFTSPMKYLHNHANLFKTKTRAFLMGSYGNFTYLFEYDKITGETRSTKYDGNIVNLKPTEGTFGFINDLDGGINFFPQYTNRNGDTWIMYQEAIDFMKNLEANNINSSNNLDPVKKRKLRKFVDDLQPDDNPVLMILYLKKQI